MTNAQAVSKAQKAKYLQLVCSNDLFCLIDIKKDKIKADMSQEEIVMIIGISRQTYCSIENSNREMTWTTYLELIFCLIHWKKQVNFL